MDDLRPELSSFGKAHIQSPNIDTLAAKSVMFTNAYCNVPVCGASRASMLSGMLPTKNRFLDYNTFAEKEIPDAVSLPQLFKENGYTTISNGKIYHHLDDRETDWDEVWRPYAFDENDTGLAPTDYWQSLWKDYHNPENTATYKETDRGPAYESAEVADSTYIDGLMAEKIIRDIKKFKKNGTPFFLTAGFISPHLPFNAPTKYWDLYDRNDIEQPENYNYIPRGAPKMSISNWPEMRSYTNIPKRGQVSDSIAIDLIHGYYATVSYSDALIGKILAALKDQGLDKNTIVVLVSDHGYNLQEHT
jgi:arylsulfatase A-like enzyme